MGGFPFLILPLGGHFNKKDCKTRRLHCCLRGWSWLCNMAVQGKEEKSFLGALRSELVRTQTHLLLLGK